MPLSRAKGKLNTSRPLLQGAKQTFPHLPAAVALSWHRGGSMAVHWQSSEAGCTSWHCRQLWAAKADSSTLPGDCDAMQVSALCRKASRETALPGQGERAVCAIMTRSPARKSDREKTLESVRQPPSGARGCAGTVLKIRSDPLCRFSQRPARNRSLSLSELDFVLACVKKGLSVGRAFCALC